MAFQFDSDSQQQKIRAPKPRQKRSGKFTLLALSAFAVLIVSLLAWRPVASAARVILAHRNVKEAHAAIAAQSWKLAYDSVTLARQRAPQDIEVILAMIAFLKATNADPGGLAQQLRLLAEQRPLTDEEELLLGRSLIASGKTQDARTIYEKLPQKQTTRPASLKLLSSILTAEGHTKEAAEITRRATALPAATPEAHLQTAVADLGSHFGEVKKHALSQLSQLAELDTVVGLDAILQLARSRSLTLIQARHLLGRIDQHPLKTLPARLSVISALIRLQPEQRIPLAQAEIQRFNDSKNGKREEIARWLMQEQLNDLALALLPKDLAMQSRELYPILVQTLAQSQRWEELQTVLKTPRPPVPPSLIDLAMAEVQSHLQPDMREARRLLQGTIGNATQASDIPTLRTAAALAERLDLADIACHAYQIAGYKAALGSSTTNASEAALQDLQKSVELALRAKDTPTLLEASRNLHQLSPSSAVFADRFTYLRLVLGVEIETVDLSALMQQSESPATAALAITLERIPPPLLLALAAYRLGDRAAMQQHLAEMPSAETLAPGPRAVTAGLLSLIGKPDRAYQIAEKIPGALLLDEELTFLKRAL